MKPLRLLLAFLLLLIHGAHADVRIDDEAFGKSLGGWSKKNAADYELSGASYRTYKPEVSRTPDGGIFVSIRIDHVRGWLSSNDHAMLEVTIAPDGQIVSAKSSIAIQGRSVTSDLIRGGTDSGQKLAGVNRAVQIGTDLVADISAKLLREKIVEPGRVSFPSALRHNYNHLFQAIRQQPVEQVPFRALPLDGEGADAPAAAGEAAAPAAEKPKTPDLEVRTFADGEQADIKPETK